MQVNKSRIYFGTFLVILFGGSIAFSIVEDISIADAVYFTIITISTVGYGDIKPNTQLGKALVLVIIVGGVGTFLGVIAEVSEFILNRGNEQRRRQKQRLLIGTFFSEFGSKLLRAFSEYIHDLDHIRSTLLFTHDWTSRRYADMRTFLARHPFKTDVELMDCAALSRLMFFNKDVIIELLRNPAFLENEGFTETLKELFHLYEMLVNRDDPDHFAEYERIEIGEALASAFRRLLVEWLDYAEYLRETNESLFEYALRKNPLYPAHALLCIVTDGAGGYNAVTLADRTPLESVDEIVVAIGNGRHSADLFRSATGFTAAIPSQSLRRALLLCGTVSGKRRNKIKLAEIETTPAREVDSRLVARATLNLECEIVEREEAYDHVVVRGRIVRRVPNEREVPLSMNEL